MVRPLLLLLMVALAACGTVRGTVDFEIDLPKKQPSITEVP